MGLHIYIPRTQHGKKKTFKKKNIQVRLLVRSIYTVYTNSAFFSLFNVVSISVNKTLILTVPSGSMCGRWRTKNTRLTLQSVVSTSEHRSGQSRRRETCQKKNKTSSFPHRDKQKRKKEEDVVHCHRNTYSRYKEKE